MADNHEADGGRTGEAVLTALWIITGGFVGGPAGLWAAMLAALATGIILSAIGN